MKCAKCLLAASLVSLLVLLAGRALAQDKHGDADLNLALKEAVNVGANLYNRFGDHAGCYRVYQGALIAVKPFLQPDLQKKVEEGLARAEKLPGFSERAFELRSVIDEIRERAKTANVATPAKKPIPAPPREEVKPPTKLDPEPDKKPGEKVDRPAPAKEPAEKASTAESGDKALVSGRVTFEGRPLPGGYFVSLVSDEGRSFSAGVQKDGVYTFRTPIRPGRYRVQIETFLEKETPPGNVEVPARYRNAATSKLEVELQAGRRVVDLDLIK
jgi:hypothetical protein